jgi:hypothetical protein
MFKSAYMTLDDIVSAVKKPMAEEKLAVIQNMESKDGQIGVTTTIIHDSGQWIKQTAFGAPTKPGPQADGSLVTYYRRYQLGAMLGLCTEADDDANAASSHAGEASRPPQKEIYTATGSQKATLLKIFQNYPGTDGETMKAISEQLVSEKVAMVDLEKAVFERMK